MTYETPSLADAEDIANRIATTVALDQCDPRTLWLALRLAAKRGIEAGLAQAAALDVMPAPASEQPFRPEEPALTKPA